MIDILKAIVLGLIQGLTEFLPVSSSGHLIAAKEVFGFNAPLAFDVILHVATLAAVLVYFGRYFMRLALSDSRWAILLRILAGTIPAALIALAFYAWREDISPWVVVIGWSVSATYLLLSAHLGGDKDYIALPVTHPILIGALQGIAAVLPGFSRSGASITSGMWLGLKREEAFRFSFLLAAPLMFGAGLFEGRDLLDSTQNAVPGGWPALLAGSIVAFVVGLIAIHVLFKLVVSKHFHRFGWYNLAMAVIFAVYLILR